MSSTPPDVVPEDPKSPKHLSFVIDFGDSKTFDIQRHKALVEKFQNRHKRGQSLSKLDELPPTASSSNKVQPSGSLPRKNSFQSEGYFSCDERGDHIKNNYNKNVQYSRLRSDLRLPLKNSNSDKMTQSFPNGSLILSCIKSPDVALQDVSSPELDPISPFSPLSCMPGSSVVQEKKLYALSSPESQMLEETIELSDTNSNKFVDGLDFDFDKSDTPSETGTYTLDTDNYTSEQKARMSIDRDFNIEQISGKQKTEEYVQSLNRAEKLYKCPASKTFNAERPSSRQNGSTGSNQRELPNYLPPKISYEEKMKVVTPILSPTQNLSIIDEMNCNDNNQARQNKEQNDHSNSDRGCFTSISTSGAFGHKNNIKNKTRSKTSLSKSQVETQTYIDPRNKNNHTIQTAVFQWTDSMFNTKGGDIINVDPALNRLAKLPPVVGGSSGKTSPTKIPSPVHSAFNRPRSRNSIADSDSSLETESFLKPTQNYINSLQKRLSLDSTHDGDFQKCNLRLNNEIQKMAHIRNNSFDDKNLQVANKLEHFQNKSLQSIDQTYINKFNQLSNPVQKIHNSPNNSPIQRSSSFSTNKNQISNVQQKVTNLVCSVPKKNNISNSPKLNQINSTQSQAAMKSYLLRLNHTSTASEHSRVIGQLGDTESSSEEDFEKHSLRKKDLSNLTSTRYNRAFALRRARLDEPLAPKCPNTPEMRRKFQAAEHLLSERAVSVDRRPMKTNSTPSRYLQSATKTKTTDKIEASKNVPKFANEKSQAFCRTDSGRFSMRPNKPNLTNKPKNTLKDFGGKKHSGARSNSSLSSREMEFQNWKRRKSYDPMKAAAEGKKKVELAKKQCQNTMTQSYNENHQTQDCDSSPSHSSSVHRSQSFHGTAALAQLISSEEEDDFTLSADEGFSPPAPSPYKLSPARIISKQGWRSKILN